MPEHARVIHGEQLGSVRVDVVHRERARVPENGQEDAAELLQVLAWGQDPVSYTHLRAHETSAHL
eukprot:7654165-Alexandrium_andersonii.AAC.1